ncbi:hypothetical protein XENORESO_007203 [Xenotaenia resolanae]|uniref:Uncharacterized protein n=1 Tax=Xenotaenia resolanae TaxID=208358 RepID=A0ABV0W1I1_9TELE
MRFPWSLNKAIWTEECGSGTLWRTRWRSESVGVLIRVGNVCALLGLSYFSEPGLFPGNDGLSNILLNEENYMFFVANRPVKVCFQVKQLPKDMSFFIFCCTYPDFSLFHLKMETKHSYLNVNDKHHLLFESSDHFSSRKQYPIMITFPSSNGLPG